MTYNVFSGTLNPAQSTHAVTLRVRCFPDHHRNVGERYESTVHTAEHAGGDRDTPLNLCLIETGSAFKRPRLPTRKMRKEWDKRQLVTFAVLYSTSDRLLKDVFKSCGQNFIACGTKT